LINLITNACKFSKKGDQIFVVLKEIIKSGQLHILIEVIDTGLGISELEQKNLFSPFFKTTD
jgi:signal transduction histidine kinase